MGPKSKIKENSFAECHMENSQAKNGSIPSRNKKRSDLKEQHDIQTDRSNDKK